MTEKKPMPCYLCARRAADFATSYDVPICNVCFQAQAWDWVEVDVVDDSLTKRTDRHAATLTKG